MSMVTKLSSATGSSTSFSSANRSRSRSSSLFTASSSSPRAGTCTDTSVKSGRVISGRTSTSAVNSMTSPSSILVRSSLGWPRGTSWFSAMAASYREGSASFTTCSRTGPRPNLASISLRGALPLRKPGMFTEAAMVLYAWSISLVSSSNGTSTVILTRVSFSFSTELFTSNSPRDNRAYTGLNPRGA